MNPSGVEGQSWPSDGLDLVERLKIMQSEYTRKYQDWPPQFQQSIRPTSNNRIGNDTLAEMDLTTMYDDTYKEHPEHIRTKCIRPRQRHISTYRDYIEYISTYKDNFRNVLTKGRKAFQPPADNRQFLGSDDEEEQGTVNQQAYRLYTMNEFLAAKRDPIVAQQEKGAVIPDVEQRMSLCATAEGASREDQRNKMLFLTTNKADFDYKRPSTVPLTAAIIKSRGQRRISSNGPFSFRSTFQDDFIHHPFQLRPRPFKPVEKYVAPDSPFQPRTLYADDFKILPVQFQGRRKPEQVENQWSSQSECDHLLTTQYDSQFVEPPKGGARRLPLRPKSKRGNKGKFYHGTSYNNSYLTYDLRKIKPRSNYKQAPKYVPPEIKFQDESTSRAHYRGEHGPPSKLCQPAVTPRIK